MALPNPPLISLGRKEFFRIIPSCFPSIDVFEGIYDSDEERELAFPIEGLTNPRFRAEAGEIYLISEDEWLTGPGASSVMAAFTHIGYSSRFADGSFGVYYAARTMAMAIAETSYHRAEFLAATQQPDQEITMRVYSGTTAGKFHDLAEKKFMSLLDPEDYTKSQLFARRLIKKGSDGFLFPSARDEGGLCLAVFRPKALRLSKQRHHLRYLYHAATESIREVLEIRSL